MVWSRDRISEATGFDRGDLFRSVEQVRDYFSVENMRNMFGECPYTQDELHAMAEAVIANRWHMVETEYCYICSENGMETKATRYALGMHLCDECAREYESYLRPGERLEDMTKEEIDRRIYSAPRGYRDA